MKKEKLEELEEFMVKSHDYSLIKAFEFKLKELGYDHLQDEPNNNNKNSIKIYFNYDKNIFHGYAYGFENTNINKIFNLPKQWDDAVNYLKQGINISLKTNNIKNAMKIITETIKNDPEYKQGWQANIAMAIYDEMNNENQSYITSDRYHYIANKAAYRFLNLLCD